MPTKPRFYPFDIAIIELCLSFFLFLFLFLVVLLVCTYNALLTNALIALIVVIDNLWPEKY